MKGQHPTSVTHPLVAFDERFVLRDEKILLKGGNPSILLEICAPVIAVRTRGQHFGEQHGIQQSIFDLIRNCSSPQTTAMSG